MSTRRQRIGRGRMACGGVSGGLFPWKRRSLRPSSVTHGGMQSRNQQLGLIRFQVKGRDSLRLSSTTAVIGNLATTATTKQIGTCKKQTDNFFFFFFFFPPIFPEEMKKKRRKRRGVWLLFSLGHFRDPTVRLTLSIGTRRSTRSTRSKCQQ